MNLAEFFKSDQVSLPRGGYEEKNQTFDDFLLPVFQDYIDLVKTVDDPEHSAICKAAKDAIPEVVRLSKQIVSAVKQYLRGYPHRAYGEIEQALEDAGIEKLITKLSGFSLSNSPQPRTSVDVVLASILHPPLYRLRSDRTAAANGALSRKDIFHVPFEKRHLVRNQRYSIAGLPSLYLGSSIWISWEELGRPDLDSVFVSRFHFAEETSVLDFQLPPGLAWQVYEHLSRQSKDATSNPSDKELLDRFDDKFIGSYIVYWPLIAACSIRVESKDGSFFPQYIVPQLLLQWVTMKHKVDGIRYFSTRSALPDPYVNANFVFPAREIKHKGCCSYLREKLHLTAPMPWELLQLLDLPTTNSIIRPENYHATIKMADGLLFGYASTGFYVAEARLRQIEAEEGNSGPVEDPGPCPNAARNRSRREP